MSNSDITEHQQQQKITSAYVTFKHNAALALLIGAPILIAIPPRKLDLYTFSLAGAFAVSANHLTRERTGRSILQHLGNSYMHTSATQPRKGRLESDAGPVTYDGRQGNKLQDKARSVWMGDAPADWKQKKLREEQEKLDQGEGYADMIVDQIWDVWNQKKEDDNKTK